MLRWNATRFIFLSASLILCIILLTSLIYQHYVKEPTNRAKKSVVYVTCAVMIIYVLFDAIYIIDILTTKHYTLMSWISFCVVIFFWYVAQLFTYTLLMLRLHYSFTGTKYAISRTVYIIFMLLVAIFLICSFISLVIFMTSEAKNAAKAQPTKFTPVMQDAQVAYYIGLEITDLNISVFLIVLFIKKMMAVTVDLYSTQSELLINDQISRMNQQQEILLDITAKYFVLSLVATCWTQICTLCMLISVVVTVFYPSAFGILWCISETMWLCDGIVNPIALYLIFEVNDRWYRKLCSGSHSFSRLCFRRCTQRKVKKKHRNLHYELQQNLI